MTSPRKPRADAQRNRERILDIAKQAFSHSGVNVGLDEIAKEAGVGAGTLYRHFPTRDALPEAVYRSEVEKLAAAERKFTETMAPDYRSRPEHASWWASKVYESAGEQIRKAIQALVTSSMESGDVRPDLEPLDLLRALAGVSYVASSPDWPQSAKRLGGSDCRAEAGTK